MADAAKDSTVTRLKFVLIDSDASRVATISEVLGRSRGVTLVENLDHLATTRTDRCVVLVADEPGAIRGSVERLKNLGIEAKVIAYAEDASPHRMVKAMSAGAADYLQWPADAANIIAAAYAVTASVAG
jgi:DNA-binding NtrC family response regulator